MTVNLTWENSGVAPFYFGWIPTLRITGSDASETVLSLDISIQDILLSRPVLAEQELGSITPQTTDYVPYAGIINHVGPRI